MNAITQVLAHGSKIIEAEAEQSRPACLSTQHGWAIGAPFGDRVWYPDQPGEPDHCVEDTYRRLARAGKARDPGDNGATWTPVAPDDDTAARRVADAADGVTDLDDVIVYLDGDAAAVLVATDFDRPGALLAVRVPGRWVSSR